MFARHTLESSLEVQASISSIISLVIHCYILLNSVAVPSAFCVLTCLFLWLWVMLIFWAVDDISYKLFVCVISGQSACLIIVLTVPYLASDMVWLITQCSHTHVGQILRDALDYSRSKAVLGSAGQVRACLRNSM